MGVIELGVVTPYEPAEPVRPDLRRYLIALVLLLSAGLLTGAAPIPQHSFTTLWRIPINGNEDSFAMNPGGVYVLSSTGERRVTAYDPRTGKIRWTRMVRDSTSWIDAAGGGVLLAPTSDGSTSQTIALEDGTGRELWRQPGDSLTVHAGLVLLIQGDPEMSAVRSLRVVDLHTGTPVWSFTAGRRRTWIATGDTDADRLVVATEDGDVTVHDFGSGRVVTHGWVPWPGAIASPDQPPGVGVAGHTFFLPGTSSEQPAMTMYDTETLHERWRLSSRSIISFYECGPVFCLNDDNGLSVYDQKTGQPLWHRPGEGYAAALHRDRLVLENGIGARRVLVDARTGRELADLGTSSLSYGDTGPVYSLALTHQPPGRTAIGELDEHTGRIDLRGALDPAADYCQSTDRLLACYTGGSRLTITEIGRAP
ncbi:PQQ-binding-like beta-propeller repeat protein [Actinoplanes sp. TFC3]|uniref:outer membrane protein assembly factor BamB family protein n=1 Tax=Actinoplanes sp. TFC3 TaxID=1710355 RepID=UPI0008366CB9|nr:PQQ-binding-like beta-propeller repeat protein [Actinoplanes sp. TFC3]